MAVALGCLAGAVLLRGVCVWLMVRDHRHARRAQADQRRWALQRQLWDVERQIWDESLSEDERERRRHARRQAAAVRREAQRRLGLPEEER
jgi:hypothetical protein